MKEAIRSFSRYALLILFVVYVGFIAFFTHVHIINGVVISHVHIESQKDKDRSTSNEPHSKSELIIYGQLSFLGASSLEISSILIKEPTTWISKKDFIPDHSQALYRFTSSSCYLRAPPFSF
ncbi:hypothetical protein HQ36_00310 [Porphyromonas gingivicanis]|uniref:Uncharacterized protein n=1 Tax=Porphyromonas gingivicanis TaxID=266762 RepID=A0A0A2G9B2_9PORP|nr:hypothetical protein [Porphyromonas gingivicanis]KGN98975.1 hypothetical protein HQ36_00310 [Porphyromonas gingivicanis]